MPKNPLVLLAPTHTDRFDLFRLNKDVKIHQSESPILTSKMQCQDPGSILIYYETIDGPQLK